MNRADIVKLVKYNRPHKISVYNCLVRNHDFLSQLPFPCRIFDVGCGVGDTTKLLTFYNNVTHVLAIDRKPELIAVADCFNDDLRIRYELVDIQDYYTFPKSIEGTFDLVTAFNSVHERYDHQAAIKNIGKLLKNDGQFLCILPGKPSQRELDLDEFLHQSKRWRHCGQKYAINGVGRVNGTDNENEHEPDHWLVNIINRNGFKVERCQTVKEEINVTEEEAVGIPSQKVVWKANGVLSTMM